MFALKAYVNGNEKACRRDWRKDDYTFGPVDECNRDVTTIEATHTLHIQDLNARSSQRFKRALEEMHTPDLAWKQTPIDTAFATLRQSVRQLSGMLDSMRRARSKG
jgi:hypothetical protein